MFGHPQTLICAKEERPWTRRVWGGLKTAETQFNINPNWRWQPATPSPWSPRAQKDSWSHLQAANTAKMNHNMNWMTCKLEAEGPRLPARGQQLTPSQLSAGALGMLAILRQHALPGMCPDLSDLCIPLAKILASGHYLHLTLFCLLGTQMNMTAEPQPIREIGRSWAAQAPQRNGNL